ncbi:MAG: diaminopimelate epimerase [Bacteroidales bacterium]|nr:diaminopimelate epimerase [Candidatus Colimorpha onthohippi]
MTTLKFYKMNGAGNDFILLDARFEAITLTQQQIAHLCHRRFGIGADGLMTLHQANTPYDFEMHYYNSDGREASMCGNGGRCITMFAQLIGIQPQIGGQYRFWGPDGAHSATIVKWDSLLQNGIVDLKMCDIATSTIQHIVDKDLMIDGWFLNTGSPHFVQAVDDLDHTDVVSQGRRIRNLLKYFPQGTNVNFIQTNSDHALCVRTYERGVEDETWSCGTGVTACAVVTGNGNICTRGGKFDVSFQQTDNAYTNIHLIGPVSINFIGHIQLT